MKKTGISRKVDDVGRVVIAKELRRLLDLEVVEVFLAREGEIVIRKYEQLGKATEKVTAIGVIKKLDELGRIVIPKPILVLYDIQSGDMLEAFTEKEDSIILKKCESKCTFCGSSINLITYGGKRICEKCAGRVSKELEKCS